MSTRTTHRHGARAGLAAALALTFAAAPAAAQAAPVDLGTAGPFVILGGSAVTNTATSVLRGDVGVTPGTAMDGLGTAVVDGSLHQDDAVARDAHNALGTAYANAAGEPFSSDMTGQDLGGKLLSPGVYRYSSSAQLTGALTLDAAGDPTARFIFQVGTALTTAPASSVLLINGASACNVFWQIGSSATLDTATAFQGNVLANTSITANSGTSVVGRLLANVGAVSLNNVRVDNSACTAGVTGPPAPTTAGTTPAPSVVAPGVAVTPGITPTPPATPKATPVARRTGTTHGTTHGTTTDTDEADGDGASATGTVRLLRTPRRVGTGGFNPTVSGRNIELVTFTRDGKRIGSRGRAPWTAFVRAAPGKHTLKVRVTFTDGTPTRTITVRYVVRPPVARNPRRGPSQFAG